MPHYSLVINFVSFVLVEYLHIVVVEASNMIVVDIVVEVLYNLKMNNQMIHY